MCRPRESNGVNINMARQYDRGKGGRREVDHAPLNTPTSTTILSSIRLDGTTADKFPNYLKEVLIPTLHQAILW